MPPSQEFRAGYSAAASLATSGLSAITSITITPDTGITIEYRFSCFMFSLFARDLTDELGDRGR